MSGRFRDNHFFSFIAFNLNITSKIDILQLNSTRLYNQATYLLFFDANFNSNIIFTPFYFHSYVMIIYLLLIDQLITDK